MLYDVNYFCTSDNTWQLILHAIGIAICIVFILLAKFALLGHEVCFQLLSSFTVFYF